ncbi:MAG: SGNH/GDSL hydrolase family protein [Planctomycetes bacterium]|nr:SGNH/GDSL hydrolase family protein [Planctomycetota bacterium]
MSTNDERSSRLRRRITAIVLGFLFAPLAAELAYRVTRASTLSPTTNPRYVVHDDELGWRYEPNARERHTSAEFDVEIAINSDGFRGPEWPPEKSGKRGKRVLVLGDSYAFGWGVRFEDTFAARLQSAHPEWEVLDAAVSGYATDQELLLLRRMRARVDPDVVVCVFCANDLAEASSDVVYGKSKPRFVESGVELELVGAPVPNPWLEQTSALWRAWKKSRWERAENARPRDLEGEWRLVLALFAKFTDELAGSATTDVRRANVPLVIVSSEDRLARFAKGSPGVRHLDLRPVLGAGAGSASVPLDGHWKARGHELVVRALEPALVEVLDPRR